MSELCRIESECDSTKSDLRMVYCALYDGISSPLCNSHQQTIDDAMLLQGGRDRLRGWECTVSDECQFMINQQLFLG